MFIRCCRLQKFKIEHAKERRRIKDEFKKGYFHDIKVLNATGGRLETPKTDFHLELPLPNLLVQDLTNKKSNITDIITGKPCVLSVIFNEFGNQLLQKYVVHYNSHLMKELPFYQLSVEESWLKSIILLSIRPHLRSKIPKDQHSLYLQSTFKKIYDFKETLNIRNKHIPWLFLINSQGVVRWTIHGTPSTTELQLFEQLAKQLK